jgi:hypothetical protein
MAGFYLMQRGWMDGDIFRNEPFCERAAWVWLVENAAYAERKIAHNGKPFVIQRGQVFASRRFLAAAWKWDDNRASRFLKKLEIMGHISTETGPGQTLITICKYDENQLGGGNDGPDLGQGWARNGPAMGQDAGHERAKVGPKYNKGNEGEERKEGKDSIPSPDPVDSDFAEWYRAYPRKVDRARALKVYRPAHLKVGPEVLLDGAIRYAAHCRAHQTVETFIKHPSTWLHASAWENDYSIKPPDPPPPPPRRKTKHDEDMEWLEQWGQSGASYPDHEGGPIIDHE